MDPIVAAAGAAMVSAMATDGWQHTRDAVVAWWRRHRPERAEDVSSELEALRSRVLTARREEDQDTEQALTGAWRLRLQQLLEEDPELAVELRRLLDEYLTPALPPEEQDRARTVVMRAEARDSARIYMAGRDQHITGS
ncbi:hypothetical protein ACG5V6_24160 [Streptomyces chitinivorans]|uniref:Uncharacterized protein n=1 Tax=Streptomyces chitinivorans TaxID=1257027 RepID=A0ABW7HZK8_9ACTN|nr:hypothetical protein [Streptomyces chitinivorans]MDH2408009.1 hypothetical protein [Streptomyces chitinivorans]